MAIDIFVQQVAERARSTGVAGLGAEGAQPHEIAGFHLDPILVQVIDRLAFEHVQAMLHDVGFIEGNDAAGLEGNDGHVHVVAQIHRIDETGGRPGAIGVRHRRRFDILLIGDEASGGSMPSTYS